LRAGDFFLRQKGAGMTRYRSENEIREVVEKFEACGYAAEEFTHARHLTVACWYLSTVPPEAALVRMRDGLLRFTAHHGKHGYHETLTRFWMLLLEGFLAGQPPTAVLTENVNGAVEHFGKKDIVYEYYSRERVTSETARREWVEPDLQALPLGAVGKKA
jgi:hypothetical protein